MSSAINIYFPEIYKVVGRRLDNDGKVIRPIIELNEELSSKTGINVRVGYSVIKPRIISADLGEYNEMFLTNKVRGQLSLLITNTDVSNIINYSNELTITTNLYKTKKVNGILTAYEDGEILINTVLVDSTEIISLFDGESFRPFNLIKIAGKSYITNYLI